MRYVITIGREYGSGGRYIGQKLAEALNIKYYDTELLEKASADSGISQAVFENYDEKPDSFLSSLMPNSYNLELSMSQKVFLAQFDTIRKIAKEESCVIVGRCADYVLRDDPNLCSFFIYSSLENRIKRAVEHYGIPEKHAKDVINKIDKKRANYYNFYSEKKWGKPESYNLCIDSSLGIDECVEVLKNFVEVKLNRNKQ